MAGAGNARSRCTLTSPAPSSETPSATLGVPYRARRPLPRTTKVARPSGLAAAQRAYARRCWESADWTPNSPSHPTRRWLWSRQGRDAAGPSFWWAELPPPPVVRYLTAFPAPGYPLDGGKPWIPQGPALVTLLAPPSAWIAAWPSIPDVHAVQLIPLDSEGRPRMNDGAKIAQANTRSVRRLLRRRG